MSKEKKNTQNEKRKLSRQERKQIDTLIRQGKRATGSPIRRRTAYRLSECIRTGFAALQTGGIPSALSLRTSTISLRSRTTKPPFLKPFAIWYNSFDASISVQLSLISRHANKDDFKNSITIAPQNDDFDSIRAEYTEMLRTQLERGNNGLIKTKFLTLLPLKQRDIRSARGRVLPALKRTTLNHF